MIEKLSSLLKTPLLYILIFVFFVSGFPPLYAYYSEMPEFICEIGLQFYRQGRYDEALLEFRKALLCEPNYAPALKYIQMIEQTMGKTAPSYAGSTPDASELIAIQKEMVKERQAASPGKAVTPAKKDIYLPQFIALDETLAYVKQPIVIEQDKEIVIRGKNINRFLVTQPEIISAQKKSSDEVVVSGKGIGYAYLHVWDTNGRWTLHFMGTYPRPEAQDVADLALLEAQRSGAFKIRYSLDWHSLEQGRRFDSFRRQNYSWSHDLNITGATPYGEVDSTAIIRTLNTTTDLTYFTFGISKGRWMNFKDFSLRGFDFYPDLGNLGLSSALRGVMVHTPAFKNKLDYTLFWGREGGGRFGNLSPGLQKIRNSFIDGFDINFTPLKHSVLGFTILHGYGRDRPDNLRPYTYDTHASWKLGKLGMGLEVGYDGNKYMTMFNGNYRGPKVNFSYELRDVNKDFLNIQGLTYRQGERGGLFVLDYLPDEKLSISQRLNVYQDRLFPAQDNDDRWNQDYDLTTRYTLDPTAAIRMNYTIQNELGRLDQLRYQSPGIGFNKSFKFIREIGTSVDYRHQENKDYTGPSSNYINDNISVGARFGIIGQLFYFVSKQWNWLEEKYTNNHSRPQVFETGVDFNSQIFKTPFFGNMRFIYHDEEDSSSPLSFLSGQDYIEGYSELSYRPAPDKEAYCSARIRNVWADNATVTKRLEGDFNAGLRYMWDTGVRWEAVCNIEGYVFKDLNSDGLRQRDEAPLAGVKIVLGKSRSVTTDIFGYYKFRGVKGKSAFVTMDSKSIPSGYVLTVPQTQEIAITHGRTSRADFGIVSRSEISGAVFFDVNGNGKFDSNDKGIKAAVIALENGKKAVTDISGRYSFRNVPTGKHTLKLELNSLPVQYLPTVPLVKEIDLFEGMVYVYNIPLKKTQ